MELLKLLESETKEVKSNNTSRGYHGEWNRAEAPQRFKAMHARLKKLFGEKRLMADVKNPNITIRDYLDSTNGRHLADVEKNQRDDDEFARIAVKTFQTFKRSYDPSQFE